MLGGRPGTPPSGPHIPTWRRGYCLPVRAAPPGRERGSLDVRRAVTDSHRRQVPQGTGRRSCLAAAVAGALATTMIPLTAGAATTRSSTHLPHMLHTREAFSPGKELESNNHRYRFAMQRDGNLVLYKGRSVLWSTRTAEHPGATASMQRDGNFVLRDGKKVLFETRTYVPGGSSNVLALQNDGNVVIYQGKKPLWWTDHPVYPVLAYGSNGSAVRTLQRRLEQLKFWVGPPQGSFDDATLQGVWAFQKAAGLARTGVVDAAVWKALARGVEARPRPVSGDAIEVNLDTDLLMIMKSGKLYDTLNTSTGGGYTYEENGSEYVAETPTGHFNIFAASDGWVTDSLGQLWRPRYFYEGYAIHGDGYVPPYPVSHGCVRVSFEAINWIWAHNLAPIGEPVWVYN